MIIDISNRIGDKRSLHVHSTNIHRDLDFKLITYRFSVLFTKETFDHGRVSHTQDRARLAPNVPRYFPTFCIKRHLFDRNDAKDNRSRRDEDGDEDRNI